MTSFILGTRDRVPSEDAFGRRMGALARQRDEGITAKRMATSKFDAQPPPSLSNRAGKIEQLRIAIAPQKIS